MQINNLTLAFLLEEIKPLAINSHVSKVQEIQKGIFKIKLHTKEGSKDLIVTDNALFFSAHSFPAKQNSHNFFSKLKKTLSNKKILLISQHDFDRVVQFSFNDFFLFFEFFHKSNVILTDKNQEILAVLRREEWKDRSLKKGEKYLFPSFKGLNPYLVSEKFLEDSFQKSKKTVFQTMISALNIAPLVAQEILFKLKIQKNLNASDLGKNDVKKIAKKVKTFYSVKIGSLKPMKVKEEILPFAFSTLSEQTKVNSLSGALDDFYSKKLENIPQTSAFKEKEVELNRLNFSLKEQKKHKEKFEKNVEENKEKADFIFEDFIELQEVINALNIALKKGVNKKEIMYKINSVLSKKPDSKIEIIEIDLKKKEIVFNIKSM